MKVVVLSPLALRYEKDNCLCKYLDNCGYCFWSKTQEGQDFLNELDFIETNLGTFIQMKMERHMDAMRNKLSYWYGQRIPRHYEWATNYIRMYELVELQFTIPPQWYINQTQWTVRLELTNPTYGMTYYDWDQDHVDRELNIVRYGWFFVRYINYGANITNLWRDLNAAISGAIEVLIIRFIDRCLELKKYPKNIPAHVQRFQRRAYSRRIRRGHFHHILKGLPKCIHRLKLKKVHEELMYSPRLPFYLDYVSQSTKEFFHL